MSPDDIGTDAVIVGPTGRFREEEQLGLGLGVCRLAAEAERLARQEVTLQQENVSLARANAANDALIEQKAKEIAELAALGGQDLSHEALRILNEVPDPRYIRAYLLSEGGKTQRDIAADRGIGRSLAWVNGALKWFRDRGFVMAGQRGSVGGRLDAGRIKDRKSLDVPYRWASVEGIRDLRTVADAGDKEVWPGEGATDHHQEDE